MQIKSIDIANKVGNRWKCSVEIDKSKFPALLVSVSYEEDLKNPEIWIELASLKHSLKIILNDKIASRGQAWLNDSPPPNAISWNSDGEEQFDFMLEPLFKENSHNKYFAVENNLKLFNDTLEAAPPINVNDLYG
jgi:hypothetical protein